MTKKASNHLLSENKIIQRFYIKDKNQPLPRTGNTWIRHLVDRSALGINVQPVWHCWERCLLLNTVPHKANRTVIAGTHELLWIRGALVWDGTGDTSYDLNLSIRSNISSNQKDEKYMEICLCIQYHESTKVWWW